MNSQWEAVIGLEIHTQLATQSKIFSGAATAYGAEPNTQACAVDLGLPGVLPVLNEDAVRKAVTFGLAIDAEIASHSVFARKNYFYPDLPKGYQISQLDHPIVGKGYLDIEVDGETKRIGVTRAHLEEDAGKSLHEDFQGLTGIDLNRAGTPAVRNRFRTGYAFRERSRSLYAQTARTGALLRNLRRQYARRLVPLRCQRLCASQRPSRIWHSYRNQKHQLLQICRKSHQLRN